MRQCGTTAAQYIWKSQRGNLSMEISARGNVSALEEQKSFLLHWLGGYFRHIRQRSSLKRRQRIRYEQRFGLVAPEFRFHHVVRRTQLLRASGQIMCIARDEMDQN